MINPVKRLNRMLKSFAKFLLTFKTLLADFMHTRKKKRIQADNKQNKYVYTYSLRNEFIY